MLRGKTIFGAGDSIDRVPVARRRVTLQLIALVMTVAVTTIGARQNKSEFHKPTELSVQMPKRITEISVSDAVILCRRTCAAALTISNKATRTIQDVTLVVQYLDELGDPLLSLPFEGRFAATEPKTLVRPEHITTLQNPIGIAGEARLQSVSPITIIPIPKSSRLTYLRIYFSDGTSSKWSSGEWQIGPLLEQAPDFFSTQAPINLSGSHICVDAEIDATGRITEVKQRNPSEGEVPRSFLEYIQNWRFSPGLSGGGPLAATLGLDITFMSHKDAMAHNDCQSCFASSREEFVFVKVIRTSSDSGKYEVLYGDSYAADASSEHLRPE